jgi:hypothetical protein
VVELRYRSIDLDLGVHFIFVFEMLRPRINDRPETSMIAEVIEWCEERFGEGAVPSSKIAWSDLSLMGGSGIAASHAWIMDHLGNIAFQYVDHALEFKFRWC